MMRFVEIAGEAVERDVEGVPTAFRVWKFGQNPTFDGDSFDTFTEESASRILAEMESRGPSYRAPFDWNHGMTQHMADPSGDRKPPSRDEGAAAGWHRVEVRRDGPFPGLWLVECEWLPAARAAILAKEYRYFSPTAEFDSVTGEILKYYNCALTNLPATHGIPALRDATNQGNQTMLNLETMIAALAALGIDPATLEGKSPEEIAALLRPAGDAAASDEAAEGERSEAAEGERSEAAAEGEPRAADAPAESTAATTPEAEKRAAPPFATGARAALRSVAAAHGARGAVVGGRAARLKMRCAPGARSAFGLPAVIEDSAIAPDKDISAFGEFRVLRNEADRIAARRMDDEAERIKARCR